MPYTQSKSSFIVIISELTHCFIEGMDLNPLFTAATSFRPSGEGTGGLDLFEKAGIELVHGWLVDPEDQEAEVLQRFRDYDRAVELIAEVDHLTDGKLVLEENTFEEPSGSSSGPGSSTRNYTDEQRKKIEDGGVFIESILIDVLLNQNIL